MRQIINKNTLKQSNPIFHTMLWIVFCLFFVFGAEGQTTSVTAAEYFIDADPGVGLGTAVTSVGTTGDIVTFTQSIPTGSLSTGFHNLHIRVKNSTGVWSIAESRSFYISSTVVSITTVIIAAEYFIDADPGVGLGTAVTSVGTTGDIVTFTQSIPTGSLSTGFHNLHIRVKNSTGVWSIAESRSFYISSTVVSITTAIIAAEYFIDADPGVGLGTAVTSVGTAGDIVTFTQSIPTGSLSTGFHNLHIRVKNSAGVWSIAESRSFYVRSSVISVTKPIIAAEYFIDTDPGVGLGTAVTSVGATGDVVTFTQSIPTSSLPAGSHLLHIRVKNQQGVWSIAESRSFTIYNKILGIDLGASAAYGLRKVGDSYTGYAIKVRSSAGGEQNIGFDASGNLDITTLKSFVGVNDGFVSVWYDQSGNGRDAFQTDILKQPILVEAGNVYKVNGKPSLKLLGNETMETPLTIDQAVGAGTLTSIISVFQANSGHDQSLISGNGNEYNIHAPWGDGKTYFDVMDAGSGRIEGPLSWETLSTGSFVRNGVQADVWKNGANLFTSPTRSTAASFSNTAINLFSFNGGNYMQGSASEMLLFNTALTTANRQTIECNEISYFSIPVVTDIVPAAIAPVVRGTTTANLSYAIASGAPKNYSINWSLEATNAGFVNVTEVALPAGNIALAVPAGATTGSYKGTLIVNGACGVNSRDYEIIVSVVGRVLDCNQAAEAAYSLRKIGENYTGYAIRVRRSNDDLEQNIGFDASGNLDTAALINFVTNNGQNPTESGYVSFWYDQSGNNKNLSQATFNQQPRIVNAGFVESNNGKPSIRFIGDSPYNKLSLASEQTVNAYLSAVADIAPYGDPFLLSDTNSYYWHGNGSQLFNSSYASSSIRNGKAYVNRTEYPLPTNAPSNFGSLNVFGVAPITANSETAWDNIGKDRSYHSSNGFYSELITFSTALSSSDREALECNQINYYSIPVVTGITLGVIDTAASGATAVLPYTVATGSPNKYSINWGPVATAAGFVDVTGAALPAGSIAVTVPAGANEESYAGTLTVNSGCGTSISYAFTVKVVGKILGINQAAAAAYSLRKLIDNYAGFAIMVRRDSDDTTSDIGFDAGGNLDTAALTSFVSNAGLNPTASGFVSVWYDQSGNARDASQADASLQPTIVNLGELFFENSRPVLSFLGAKGFDFLSEIPQTLPSCVFGVYKNPSSSDWVIGLQRKYTNNGPAIYFANGSSNSPSFYWDGAGGVSGSHSSSLSTQKEASWFFSNTNTSIGNNSILESISDYNKTNVDSWTSVGYVKSSPGTQPFIGTLSEIIIFNSNQLANRQTIECNQIGYYKIIGITPGVIGAVVAGVTTAKLPYTAAIGAPTSYSINWDLVPTTAGFINVTGATLPASDITIAVPAGATPGSYTGTLVVSSACGTSVSYAITVPVVSPILGSSQAAAAAYSLRKLVASYAGFAIRVRRSTGGELNIGFDANGDLDTSSLSSFVSNNGADVTASGFVSVWYDQSGNGRNAIQTDTNLQPIIVNSGNIETLNGKPSVKFTSQSLIADDWLAGNPESDLSMLVVSDNPGTVNRGQDGSGDGWSINGGGSVVFTANGAVGYSLNTTTSSSQNSIVMQQSNSNSTIYYYYAGFGATTTIGNHSLRSSTQGTLLGAGVGSGSYVNGSQNEVILFATALSTIDRQTIECNQFSYYKILSTITGVPTTIALTTSALGGKTAVSGCTGTWSQSSGPGTTVFSDIHIAQATATVSLPGTYTFVWSVTNGFCTATDNISVTLTGIDQTITFTPAKNPVPVKTYGDSPFVVTATASSGEPVTLSLISGPATFNAGTGVVTITGTGTIVLQGFQAGGNSYGQVTDNLSITVNKATASISLSSLTQTYNGTPRPVTATTNPLGTTVIYTYDGSGTTPTNAGTYVVVATINTINYQGTATGTLVIQPATQTINLLPITDQNYNGLPVAITAASSSGLPVALTIVSTSAGLASISGTTISLLGNPVGGIVTVTASQAGNGNYLAASDVSVQFNVIPAILYDVEMVSLLAPTVACGLGQNPAITVRLKNNGFYSITNFQINLSTDGGIAQTETYTGTIASGATVDYTLNNTPNLISFNRSYAIALSTDLINDENRANDVLNTIISRYPADGTSISSDISICKGESTTLLTMGGSSTIWDTGFVGSTYMVSPSSTTTYTATIIDANGCGSFNKTVTVKVIQSPTVIITNPAAICFSETADLTLAAVTIESDSGLEFSYWKDDLATIPYTTFTSADSGTYYIKGTDAIGCSSTKPVTVTKITSVGGTIAGSTTVCMGANSSILILRDHTGTIQGWQSSTDGFTSVINDIANDTNTLVINNLIATTEYRAVVQNSNCGIAYSSVATISVPPMSIGGIISGTSTLCSGDNTILTLSGNVGNVVRWESSIDNFVVAITRIAYTSNVLQTANLLVPTQYRAVVRSGNCLFAYSSNFSITVNPLPKLVITNPNAVCSPVTIDLTAASIITGSAAGLTYTYWTDNVATVACSSPTSLSTGGIYYIKGTNTTTGCFTIKPVNVKINIPVIPTFTPIAPICKGSILAPLPKTSTNGISGNWTPGLNNTVTTTYTFTPNVTACAQPTTLTIQVDPFTVAGTIRGLSSFCGSASTTLQLEGSTGTVIRWESSTDNFATVTTIDNITNSLEISNLQVTTKYRAVVQSGSCSVIKTAKFTVIIYPIPVATLPSSVTIQKGDSTTLFANTDPFNSLIWTLNGVEIGYAASIDVAPIVTTTYTAIVTSQYGCTSSYDVVVNVTCKTLVVNAGIDVDIPRGGRTILTATTDPSDSLVWQMDGADIANTASIEVAPLGTTSYTATVTNKAGCSNSSDVVVVNVLYKALEVGPTTIIDFGYIATTTTATKPIYIINKGTMPVTINGATLVNSSPSAPMAFSILFPVFPLTIMPGNTVTLNAQFQPTDLTLYSASLVLDTDMEVPLFYVTLKGSCVGANPSWRTSTSEVFGKVPVNTTSTKILYITNNGNIPIDITGVTSSNPAFSGTLSSNRIEVGAKISLTIPFSPTAVKDYAGNITVLTSIIGLGDINISLSGTGYNPGAVPQLAYLSVEPYSDILGVNPNIGPTGFFTYQVKYISSINAAPQSGYPKVGIDKNGDKDFIDNGEGFFSMSQVGSGADWVGGEIFTFTTNLPIGRLYSYKFMANDTNGNTVYLPETPDLLNLKEGPIVTSDILDLYVTAADVQPSKLNPNLNEDFTITATIHNPSIYIATNVKVGFYIDDVLVDTKIIPLVPAFTDIDITRSIAPSVISLPMAYANSAIYTAKVWIDKENTLGEANILNNVANRPILVGTATSPSIIVTGAWASLSESNGIQTMSITGNAVYPIASNSVPVAGGEATILIKSPNGDSHTVTAFLDKNGNFSGSVNIVCGLTTNNCFPIKCGSIVPYDISVTDFSLVGTGSFVYEIPPCIEIVDVASDELVEDISFILNKDCITENTPFPYEFVVSSRSNMAHRINGQTVSETFLDITNNKFDFYIDNRLIKSQTIPTIKSGPPPGVAPTKFGGVLMNGLSVGPHDFYVKHTFTLNGILKQNIYNTRDHNLGDSIPSLPSAHDLKINTALAVNTSLCSPVGGKRTIGFIVKNSNCSSTGNFYIKVYDIIPSDPTRARNLLTTIPCNLRGATPYDEWETFQKFEYTNPNWPVGPRDIIIVIDSEGDVPESDETNNTIQFQYWVTADPLPYSVIEMSELPSLVNSNTSLSGHDHQAGSKVHLSTSLINLGSGGEPKPFKVTFSMNGLPLGDPIVFNGLAPGESISVNSIDYTCTNDCGLLYGSNLVLDNSIPRPADCKRKGNWDYDYTDLYVQNNCNAEASSLVWFTTKCPPVLAKEGVRTKFSIHLYNGHEKRSLHGDCQAVHNVKLNIIYDNQIVDTVVVPYIAGCLWPDGDGHLVEFFCTLTKPGLQNIYVQVDPDNAICETDDANNIGIVEVTTYDDIGGNLNVLSKDIITGTNSPKLGEPIQVSTSFSNIGDKQTGGFVMRFYVNDVQLGADIHIANMMALESVTKEATVAYYPVASDFGKGLVFKVILDGDRVCNETILLDNVASRFVPAPPPFSASIAYPGSPYCGKSGIGSVVITKSDPGVTGLFTASPLGLSIDAITGDIDLAASLPGVYKVVYTYTFPNYLDFTTTTSIAILSAISPTISYNGSPFCAKGTASVTQSGSVGGAYSSTPAGLIIDAVTGIINLDTSASGTYTVSYDTSGCFSVATADVTILALPTINGKTSLCKGATSQLTGSGSPASINAWVSSNPLVATVDNTGLVSTVDSGTTNIIYTDANGCSPNMPTAITVNSLTNVTGNTAICLGGRTQLTGSGSPALVDPWVSSDESIVTVTNSGLVTSIAFGTANITYTDLNGCSPPSPPIITTSVLPTATISGTTPICSGNTAVITFNGTPNATVTYAVDGVNQTVVLDATGVNTAVTPALATASTYVLVSVSDGICSQAQSGSAIVTINPLPTATISGTTSICSRSTTAITFNGTPNATVTYAVDGVNQTVVLDATGVNTVVTPALATASTYVLVSVSKESCSQAQSGSAIVTINPLPTATISGTALICSGSTTAITFNGTPNATVTYTVDGVTGQTIVLDATGSNTVVTPVLTTASTYALVSVSDGICSQVQTGTATITIKALPTATISGTTSICSGSTTAITFNGTPNATVTYAVDGVSQTVVLDATGNNIVVTPALTIESTYTLVSVSDSICSQAQMGSATVTINGLPTATISGTTSICSGSTTAITFNGTPNATVTYAVDGGADQTKILDGSGYATLATGNLSTTTVYSLVSVLDGTCTNSLAGSVAVTVAQQSVQPATACYESATFSTTTCQWDVTGTQPAAPTGLACYETATFNTTTCQWDVTGTQNLQPAIVNCWDNFVFNTGNCTWDNTGAQTPQPVIINCWDNFVFNTGTCIWDNIGTQDPMPTGLACYETATFNTTTCVWDVTGTQDPMPTGLACYETATFNTTTCVWDVTGTQDPIPTGLACYETATFNTTNCVWDVTGTQDLQPAIVNCWDNFVFNTGNCTWDNTGAQTPQPVIINCWDNFVFNTGTCIWDNIGTQDPIPTGLACYESATFNTTTCQWEMTRTQPAAPTGLACYETATFNTTTCVWDLTVLPGSIKPTFNGMAAFCSGTPAPILPTTSLNGISGSWIPAIVSNTISAIYTFTPDAAQCAINTTLDVTVLPVSIKPSFNGVAAICSETPAPILPVTSIEGITGSWSPATVSNTISAIYTFTPDAAQCGINTTLDVTVLPASIKPTFNGIVAFYANTTAPVLPTISLNGISGSWNPATVSNMASATYTFTPNAGQCALNAKLDVTVLPVSIKPTFDSIATICSGTPAPILPTTSIEGITGSWNPAPVCNTTSATYTFIPDIGQSALNSTMYIAVNSCSFSCGELFVDSGNVNDNYSDNENATTTISPTSPLDKVKVMFNSFDLENGHDYLKVYDGNSAMATLLGSFTGATLPPTFTSSAVNGCLTFVFTSDAAMTKTGWKADVSCCSPITPLFDAIAPLCYGDTALVLPITSREGIIGRWSPVIIDNTVSSTYTFIPEEGQCALSTTLKTTVLDSFNFNITGGYLCDNYVLDIKPLLNSFDLSTSNFNWKNDNGVTVGLNKPSFNVSSYINSTVEEETFPLAYTGTVTLPNGCNETRTFIIDKIYGGVQKGISPNGDNLNDFFDLSWLDVKHLSIYNRYGTKVYTKTNYTNQWVGQSDNGDKLPDGTYYYFIDELNNCLTSKTGWIYINREK